MPWTCFVHVCGRVVNAFTHDMHMQAEVVRKLKSDGCPKLEIQSAVAELKVRKKALEKREAELTPNEEKFDRSGLEDLLKRRFFYTQSFAIYGGKLVFSIDS